MKKKKKNQNDNYSSKKVTYPSWCPCYVDALKPFHMISLNACLNKSVMRFDAHVKRVKDSLQKDEFTWLLGRKKPENRTQ